MDEEEAIQKFKENVELVLSGSKVFVKGAKGTFLFAYYKDNDVELSRLMGDKVPHQLKEYFIPQSWPDS